MPGAGAFPPGAARMLRSRRDGAAGAQVSDEPRKAKEVSG